MTNNERTADVLDEVCEEILSPDGWVSTVEEVVELLRERAKQLRTMRS